MPACLGPSSHISCESPELFLKSGHIGRLDGDQYNSPLLLLRDFDWECFGWTTLSSFFIERRPTMAGSVRMELFSLCGRTIAWETWESSVGTEHSKLELNRHRDSHASCFSGRQ